MLVAEPVSVTAQHSWKICLIVAELVTNATRHAFQRSEGGSITIKLFVDAGVVCCAVIDNGSAKPSVTPGRGTSILNAIALEVGGTITRSHTEFGSAIVLEVPLLQIATEYHDGDLGISRT